MAALSSFSLLNEAKTGKGSHDYARGPMTEAPYEIQEFDDEQRRALIDSAQVYETYVARAPETRQTSPGGPR